MRDQVTNWTHVEMYSGRCISSDCAAFVGHWIYTVAVVDDLGGTLQDYVGTDRHEAETRAASLGRDFRCPIVDRSTGEV